MIRKFIPHFFLPIVGILILSSCRDYSYVYRAQPVDLNIINNNGKIRVEGASVLQAQDSFVWGASPIKIKNKYYLFYSTWESGPQTPQFSDSWLLCSKIGCAVSDSPQKGYHSLGIILKGRNADGQSTAWDAQSAHNPLIKTFNGKYYLYYVSSVDPGEQPVGSPGAGLNKRNRLQQNQKIGVIEFNSIQDILSGHFIRSEYPLLSPRTRVKENIINPSPLGTKAKPDNLIVVNPAVSFRPSDKKYLLFFKGNIYDPGWRGVHGVAIGDSPTGPFIATDQFVFDIVGGNGNKVSAEDPYVWYHQKNKRFYAILKDFTGELTGGEAGLAMMESGNGVDWMPYSQALFMKKELILKNGDTVKVDRLERPQLLLDNNDEPIVLFAACSIDPCNNKTDGGTFNIQVPIKKWKLRKK